MTDVANRNEKAALTSWQKPNTMNISQNLSKMVFTFL